MEFGGAPLDLVPVFVYRPNFYEFEEEKLHEVIITQRSELVELGENSLVFASCNLPCSLPLQPQNSSVSIKVFYTYQPYCKYYLVHINKELFIIKKVHVGQLKVHKILNTVATFFIKHFEHELLGKIFACCDDNNLPSAVDLYNLEESIYESNLIGDALLKVKSEIQGLDTRLKSAQQVLGDKRIFAHTLSGNLMMDPAIESHLIELDTPLKSAQQILDDKRIFAHTLSGNLLMSAAIESHLTGIPLIRVISDSPVIAAIKRTCLITFGKLWARICFNSWVIGIFLSNKHESAITNVELFAAHGGYSIKQTTVWIRNDPELAPFLTDFRLVESLPADAEGYVIGVINEPLIITTQFKLPFVLSYNVEGSEKQPYLGSIIVSLQQELSNNYRPFEKENEVSDLLSLITISSCIDISYQKPNENLDIRNLFIDMGFTELSVQYYVYKFKEISPLSGTLIFLCEPQYLKIYFRRKQQLIWVLDLLNRKLSWNIVSSSLFNRAVALNQEIIAVEKYIRAIKVMENPSLAGWTPVFLQHEKQTDIAFNCN